MIHVYLLPNQALFSISIFVFPSLHSSFCGVVLSLSVTLVFSSLWSLWLYCKAWLAGAWCLECVNAFLYLLAVDGQPYRLKHIQKKMGSAFSYSPCLCFMILVSCFTSSCLSFCCSLSLLLVSQTVFLSL